VMLVATRFGHRATLALSSGRIPRTKNAPRGWFAATHPVSISPWERRLALQ
jgi:hypothetical protein